MTIVYYFRIADISGDFARANLLTSVGNGATRSAL